MAACPKCGGTVKSGECRRCGPVSGPRVLGCQWIEREPSATDRCKCGRPVQPGSAYCPVHHARAWRRKGAPDPAPDPAFLGGLLRTVPLRLSAFRALSHNEARTRSGVERSKVPWRPEEDAIVMAGWEARLHHDEVVEALAEQGFTRTHAAVSERRRELVYRTRSNLKAKERKAS